jgi:hypothetical protein
MFFQILSNTEQKSTPEFGDAARKLMEAFDRLVAKAVGIAAVFIYVTSRTY